VRVTDEPIEQIEQSFLGPVEVLHVQQQRLRRGEALEERPEGIDDLGLVEGARFDPDRARDRVGDRGVGQAHELLPGVVWRILVMDPSGLANDLGERPIRDALAIRETTARVHAGTAG
jgi:hypothetical protein